MTTNPLYNSIYYTVRNHIRTLLKRKARAVQSPAKVVEQTADSLTESERDQSDGVDDNEQTHQPEMPSPILPIPSQATKVRKRARIVNEEHGYTL